MVETGKLLPERRIFYRRQVRERVGRPTVEVCGRVGREKVLVLWFIHILNIVPLW